MQQELAREQAQLVLPGMQRPYFMEYRLEDISSWEAAANYGALTSEHENHQRVVRVEVRIGDYASDSSSARGDGSLQLAPEDNDPAALKFALWTATDEAYKNALRAYATKQANRSSSSRARPRPTTSPPPSPSRSLSRWSRLASTATNGSAASSRPAASCADRS
jgi:hypothetical protein